MLIFCQIWLQKQSAVATRTVLYNNITAQYTICCVQYSLHWRGPGHVQKHSIARGFVRWPPSFQLPFSPFAARRGSGGGRRGGGSCVAACAAHCAIGVVLLTQFRVVTSTLLAHTLDNKKKFKNTSLLLIQLSFFPFCAIKKYLFLNCSKKKTWDIFMAGWMELLI